MRRRSLHGPLLVVAIIGVGYMAYSAPQRNPEPEARSGIPATSAPTVAGASVEASRDIARGSSGAPTPAPLRSRPVRRDVARSPHPSPQRPRATAGVSAVPLQHATPRPKSVATAYVRLTWYCGNGSRCTRGYSAGGLYAAISPDLRAWNGRLIRVIYGGRSVTVRAIDCNCQAEHGIDLYAAAFQQLAPLSVGSMYGSAELLP